MKKISKALMFLAAALLLAPLAKAQGIHYDATSGFTFDKYVKDKNPDANGEYTLRIETFATGEVTVEKKSIPSDIVLVIDASGSMGSLMIHPSYKVRQKNNANWTFSGTTDGDITKTSCIFIRYPDAENGVLYPITHYRQDTSDPENGTAYNDYWLSFTTNDGQTKYVYGTWKESDKDAWVHDERPAVGTYPTQSSRIASGPLYKYPTRQQAIQYAVGRFIDLIRENDQDEVVPYLNPGVTGNQISIVQFTGYGDPEAIAGDYPDFKVEQPSGKISKTVIGFTPVTNLADNSDLTNVNNLKAAANTIPASGNTPHDTGMRIAQLLIQGLDEDMPGYVGSTEMRHKTVVFFTDGKTDVGGSSRTKATSMKNAMTYAYDLKQNYHVKIFTVGFTPDSNDAKFLKYLSSNYPDGTYNGSTYGGTIVDADPEKQIYFMDAGTADMTSVFEAIAESVGGGSSSGYDNAPLVSVDMVSSSFQLPANADASRVKVYTAQCLGTTGETFVDKNNVTHDVLAFADPVLVGETPGGRPPVYYYVSTPVLDGDGNPVPDELGNPSYSWEKVTEDIDASISIDVDRSTNTVTVGGFEFEKLWCGHDPEHDNQKQYEESDYPDTFKPGYRGFKIIIEFPIVVKDGAAGGPLVGTNLATSGVYQTDEQGNKDGLPIVEYPIPTLPIPINLWIEKRGLLPGESASFTIYCKEVEPVDPNNNPYRPFTRVNVIGSEDGSPVSAKLLNLDPSFYYKIWEEGWSWTYSNQAQDLESAPSTEEVKDNHFIIKNDYDDPDLKHAEAAKRNVMEKTTSTTNP